VGKWEAAVEAEGADGSGRRQHFRCFLLLLVRWRTGMVTGKFPVGNASPNSNRGTFFHPVVVYGHEVGFFFLPETLIAIRVENKACDRSCLGLLRS
jgi:hypothetical protein